MAAHEKLALRDLSNLNTRIYLTPRICLHSLIYPPPRWPTAACDTDVFGAISHRGRGIKHPAGFSAPPVSVFSRGLFSGEIIRKRILWEVDCFPQLPVACAPPEGESFLRRPCPTLPAYPKRQSHPPLPASLPGELCCGKRPSCDFIDLGNVPMC